MAEVHATLGWTKGFYDLDLVAAEKHLRRSIEINPEYPISRQWLAIFLLLGGKAEESLKEIRQALALDPLSLSVNTAVADIIYIDGQYDSAIEHSRKVLQLYPEFGPVHGVLADSYVEKGMTEEAARVLERFLDKASRNPHHVAHLIHALARAGKLERAGELYSKTEAMSGETYVPSYLKAQALAALGRKDDAFEHLEKVIEERYGLLYMSFDPSSAISRMTPDSAKHSEDQVRGKAAKILWRLPPSIRGRQLRPGTFK
jgi:tetratricopeptide (TPR) repeat protein